MAEHDINIRTRQRFKQFESDISDDRRRPHKVYFTDAEWKVIVGKADWVNRAPSVYLREVGLGYKTMCEIGFLKRWTEGVSKILDFLDKWIKRV